MSDKSQTSTEIFAQAIEIASAEERQVFLEQACAGDGQLRAKVEGLLKAHQAAGSFLEKPIARIEDQILPETGGIRAETDSNQDPPADHGEGRSSVIGPCKLLQQIGEGGMARSGWRSRKSRSGDGSH